MAAKAHKLGPGVLTLGEAGSLVEFGTRLRKVALEPKYDVKDAIPVLSGDELQDAPDEAYELTGSVFQDYDLDSLIAWCHINRGKVVPFTFRPDNDKALGATGHVYVTPITMGGDVKERNESDFKFAGREGFYELADFSSGTPVTITAWTEVPDSTPTAPTDWN